MACFSPAGGALVPAVVLPVTGRRLRSSLPPCALTGCWGSPPATPCGCCSFLSPPRTCGLGSWAPRTPPSCGGGCKRTSSLGTVWAVFQTTNWGVSSNTQSSAHHLFTVTQWRQLMKKPPRCRSALTQSNGAMAAHRYSRSVTINLDGVDAVLGQALHPQEGTVFTELHTLAGEVVSLKQLDPIVLSVLRTNNDKSTF